MFINVLVKFFFFEYHRWSFLVLRLHLSVPPPSSEDKKVIYSEYRDDLKVLIHLYKNLIKKFFQLVQPTFRF